MVFLLFLAVAPASAPLVSRPVSDARASVHIVRAEPASRDWSDPNVLHKREIEVREADQGRTLLRLIEHE